MAYNDQGQVVVPSRAGNPQGDLHGVFIRSGGARSIEAMFGILEAATQNQINMAAMSQSTTMFRKDVTNSLALETERMGLDDAYQLHLQGGEQFAGAVSQVFSFIGGAKASKVTKAPETQMKQMESLTKEVNAAKFTAKGGAAGNAVPAAVAQAQGGAQAPTALKEAALKEARAQILGGKVQGNRFDFTNVSSLSSEVSVDAVDPQAPANAQPAKQTLTMREILESGTGEELESMKAVIGNQRKLATKALLSATNRGQTQSQFWQAGGQAMSGLVSGGLKNWEATKATDKADAQKDQTYLNSGQEFLRDSNKTQSDEAQRSFQSQSQVLTSIEKLVGINERG